MGSFQVMSNILFIQYCEPSPAKIVCQELLGACILQHPLLSWPCVTFALCFWLCIDLPCHCSCIAKWFVQVQIQYANHGHNMITKDCISPLLSSHKRQLSLNGLKFLVVPKELEGAAYGWLGGRIVWSMPAVIAYQLLWVSALEVFKVAWGVATGWWLFALIQYCLRWPPEGSLKVTGVMQQQHILLDLSSLWGFSGLYLQVFSIDCMVMPYLLDPCPKGRLPGVV